MLIWKFVFWQRYCQGNERYCKSLSKNFKYKNILQTNDSLEAGINWIALFKQKNKTLSFGFLVLNNWNRNANKIRKKLEAVTAYY